MISDEEIPEAPLLIEVQIIQGKNMTSKKDPYVMIKVGGDEVYRTSTAKKVFNPTWQGDPFVGKYEAEEDGPIYLEVASGRGSWQSIIGRSLIPLRGCEERKTIGDHQPPIWLKVAGSADSAEPSELQVSILAEPIIHETNVMLPREKKPVRLILIADALYVFSDVDKCHKLRRRVPLGVNSKISWDVNTSEIHIEPAATENSVDSAPFTFKADLEIDALRWKDALRPFIGPITTPIFGVSLDDAMYADRILNPWNTSGIPAFVDSGLKFIEEHGLEEQGVFRLGYSSFSLDDAVRRIETGQRFIEEFDSVHMVTSILKKYFRSLPECLMTSVLLDEALQLFGNDGQENPSVETLMSVIAKLPAINAQIIERVFRLCYLITCHQDVNMMNDRNLSIVIGPTVFCVDSNTVDVSMVMLLPKVNSLTMFMINNFNELFPNSLGKGDDQHPPLDDKQPPTGPQANDVNPPSKNDVVNDNVDQEEKSFPAPPPKHKRPDKVRLFAPVDPDDLESALRQGLAIYKVYGNGGGTKGWVEEERLCDLLVDLNYVGDTEHAKSILEDLFPQMPIPRNRFVIWWMDNHDTLIPFSP